MGAPTYYQMGLQAERAGNLDGALQHYRDAIEMGGDIRATVGSYVRVAHIQMLRRADAEAEQAIDAALQRDPNHSEARLAQARLMLLQDKPRRAARIFEEMARREQVAVESLVGLIESALILSDESTLTRARSRLMAWIGNRQEVRIHAAQKVRESAEFFANTGKASVAVSLAEISFALDPSHTAKRFLAEIRYQSNQLDAAAELFQELLSDPDARDEARAMLAQIEVQRNELQLESKRARLREIHSAAQDAEIAGRLPEAILAYEEMIKTGRGVFAAEIRDVDTKLAILRRRYAEKTAVESRVQASAALRGGHYEEAVDLLNRAKSVVGTDLVLDGMLAESLLKSAARGDPAAREDALNKILVLQAELDHAGASLRSDVLAQTREQLGLLCESQKRWSDAAVHFAAAKRGPASLPDLSRRLWMARIRANVGRGFLGLVVIVGLTGLTHYVWPNAYRTVVALVRYKIALRQNDRDRRYHALTALAALLPHRTDLRRTLAKMADDKGDPDVSLYLYEQLWRERSLDKEGLLNLFHLYERQKAADKLYGVIGDLLNENVAGSTRAKILETKFRLDLDAGRPKEAFLAGHELLAAKPTAWVAEQMIKLLQERSVGGEKQELQTFLMIYRTWSRLQPTANDRIASEAEVILKSELKAGVAGTEGLDPKARLLAQFVLELHLKSGNQKRAADLLEAIRMSEKDPVPTLQTLIKLYSSLGDADALFRTRALLYEAQPSHFEYGMQYAALLEKRGDERAKESVLLELLTHHPNSVELVKSLLDNSRAQMESADGSGLDRPIQTLRAIVGQTFLDTKEARLLLARGLMKKGLTDEAIAILQAIEGGGYPRLKAQAITAEAFLRKNQPGLAVDILSKVNFEDPQITEDLYKEMRYLQADALESQNRMEEAVVILDELILRDITFRDVKERHDRLAHVRRRSVPQEGCPSCGKPNPAGSRFCSTCGKPMASV